MEKKFNQFYYHPKSCDNNGNGGPSTLDKGWRVVLGKNMNEAKRKLPVTEIDGINQAIIRYAKENNERAGITLDQFIEDTCGRGIGFTFIGEDDWNEQCFNDSSEE